MAVIISHTIRAKELQKGPLGLIETETVLKYYKRGIFTYIKGVNLPGNSKLNKVYATTIQGARRILYLVNTQTGNAFLLLYRSKNDTIGNNMSIKNPEFEYTLDKYLSILMEDIAQGKVDTYE